MKFLIYGPSYRELISHETVNTNQLKTYKLTYALSNVKVPTLKSVLIYATCKERLMLGKEIVSVNTSANRPWNTLWIECLLEQKLPSARVL
jgi:hypothetical protein